MPPDDTDPTPGETPPAAEATVASQAEPAKPKRARKPRKAATKKAAAPGVKSYRYTGPEPVYIPTVTRELVKPGDVVMTDRPVNSAHLEEV